MDIPYISISRSGVFTLCQAQYKFKYHLGVKSPEPEPFYFVYGKIIHRIAEEWVSGNSPGTINEVAHGILSGEIEFENGEKAPAVPPDYRRRMPEHLTSIETITNKIGKDGLFEQEFMYDLDPPNNKCVKGVIDRLIIRGDDYFILDYKTTKKGKYRKTPQTITKDLQLRTYAKYVQKQYNAPAKNIMAALYYLEGGNLIPARYNQQQLDSAEEELLATFNKVANTPPDKIRANVGQHCDRCDFRSMCSYYSVLGKGLS